MSITKTVDLQKYIDNKNRSLYNSLSKDFEISLSQIVHERADGNNSLWFCRINQNEVNISYYLDINTSAFFTHELLHVDLIKNGFTNFIELMPFIQETSRKELIFTGIIGHINNILGHAKFYDNFISLGYTPEEFTNDYHSKINIDEIKNRVNDRFYDNSLPNESLCHYITSFFSAKDNRNPDRTNDYEELLIFLKNTDERLYEILEQCWSSWTRNDTLDNRTLLENLFENTEQWHKSRN